MTSPKPFSFLVDRNQEHLRLLGLYHGLIAAGFLVVGVGLYGLPLIFGPAFYEVVSTLKILPSPVLWAGLLVTLLQVTVLGLNGWCLWRRKNHISAIILSCVECLCAPPLGFLLGISAVLVLRRESVKALFDMASSASGGALDATVDRAS